MSFINFWKTSSLINKNITPALCSISLCSGVQAGWLINHHFILCFSMFSLYFSPFFLSVLHSGYYHRDYYSHSFFICVKCVCRVFNLNYFKFHLRNITGFLNVCLVIFLINSFYLQKYSSFQTYLLCL